jgi:uncharacterized protein involved in outer membrane biogenesis
MGRLLTAIGFLVIVLFAAAASAPFLVDWNQWKPTIEQEAARLLGVPVAIDGRIEAQLVPSPALSFERLRIGVEGAETHIDQVQLELSVGALLKGEVHVVEARLSGPKLWLRVDAQGRLVGEAPRADLSRVAIERIEVEGGEVTLETATDGARLFVDNIAFAGEATSLAGPWRVEGGARFEGARLAFTAATGRWEAGSMRVRVGVDPTERPVAGEFDGALGIDQGRPQFGGTLRLRGVGAADAAARDRGWRVESAIEARPDRLIARDIRLVPSAERIVQFTGTINVAIGPRSRLDAALATRQLDVDRLAGIDVDTPVDVPAILARLGGLPSLLAIPPLDGRVTLDIGSLVLAGGLVQDARVAAEMREGRWRLTDAQARLPGQGTLRASGDFGLRGGPVLFEGPVELAVRVPTAFSAWLEGDLLRPREQRAQGGLAPVTLGGRVTLSHDRLAVAGLTASVGAAALTGDVAFQRTGTPRRLQLRLSAPDLDVEPLVALVSAFAPRTIGAGIEAVDAVLRADRLRYRALDMRQLDVAVRSGAGGTSVERLHGRLNGVELTGDGRIDAAGAGSVRVRIVGDRLAPAIEAIEETFGASAPLTWLSSRASAFSPATLDLTVTRREAGLDIALAGLAGGGRLDVGATLDSVAATPAALARATVALANPRADRLLAQFGIEAIPAPGERQARASMSIERAASETHRLAVDADIAGTRLGAVGAVSLASATTVGGGLAVAASSADAMPFLLTLGLPIASPDQRIPASLRARLGVEANAIRVTALDGTLDGVAVRGDLGATRQNIPRIDGSLAIASIALERILGLVTGPMPPPQGSETWSSTAFGPRPLPAMTGAVSVSTDRLRVDRYDVTDARLAVRIGEGGLAIEGLTGHVAGGRLAGELVLSRPDAGVRLAGRMVLSGVRLEDLVWRRGDRAVASGRMDARLSFEGVGRTPSVLVGALSGEGTLGIAQGEIKGIATTGFTAGLRAGEAGMALDEARLLDIVRTEMDQGALSFQRLDAALSLQAGVVRATNLRLDGAPALASGRVTIDLPRWTLDADWSLEAASAASGQRGPRLGLVFRGPIDQPERRIDVRAFVDHLNMRRFEREVERLEALQRDIDQRERVLREIQERERERREQEERERARREEEERARQAPQPVQPERPAQAPPARTPGSAAEERSRFNDLIRDALRAPAAPNAPAAGLSPLPPPVVIAPAPGAAPTRPAGRPIELVPSR